MSEDSSFSEKIKDPKHMVKAGGYFFFVGTVYTSALWSFCYLVKPTTNIMRFLPVGSVKSAIGKAKEKAAKLPFLKILPVHQRGPVVFSLCETIVMKSLLAPVCFPLKIWLVYKLSSFSRSYNE